MRAMNWIVILGFSLIGVVMGFASVTGIPTLVQWPMWVAVGGFFAYWLAKNLPSKQPLHGFLIGLIAGLITPIIQTVFFSTYIDNNPQVVANIEKLPANVDPRQYVLSFAPVIGLFQGTALAVFTWTVGNLYRKPSEESEAAQDSPEDGEARDSASGSDASAGGGRRRVRRRGRR